MFNFCQPFLDKITKKNENSLMDLAVLRGKDISMTKEEFKVFANENYGTNFSKQKEFSKPNERQSMPSSKIIKENRQPIRNDFPKKTQMKPEEDRQIRKVPQKLQKDDCNDLIIGNNLNEGNWETNSPITEQNGRSSKWKTRFCPNFQDNSQQSLRAIELMKRNEEMDQRQIRELEQKIMEERYKNEEFEKQQIEEANMKIESERRIREESERKFQLELEQIAKESKAMAEQNAKAIRDNEIQHQKEMEALTTEMKEKEIERKKVEEKLDSQKQQIEKINKRKSEKEKKIERALQELNDCVDDIQKKHIANLNLKLQDHIKDYYDNNIQQLSLDQFIDSINDLFKIENFGSKLQAIIRGTTCDIIENLKKTLNHINVAVVGKTGVGKSTLINAFLKLEGDERAKTSSVKPETKGDPKAYSSNEIPFLRLYDTRGVELDGYSSEQMIDSISSLVDQKGLENDPDQFIDAIWYCISAPSSRMEPIEEESFEKLMNKYEGGKLPIIVVLTKASTEFEKAANTLKDYIEVKTNKNINIVLVDTKTDMFGFDDLFDITALKCIETVSSGCLHSIQVQLNKFFENMSKKISNCAMKEADNSYLEIPIEDLLKILSNQLKLFLLKNENEPSELSPNTIDILNRILNHGESRGSVLYNAFMNKLPEEYGGLIAIEIISKQLEIERKNMCFIRNSLSKDQWKEKNTIIIKSEIEITCKRQLFKLLNEYMVKEFEKKLTQIFTETVAIYLKNMKPELDEISKFAVNEETNNLFVKIRNNVPNYD